MAKNTVSAYCYAVNDYFARHKVLNKKNLLLYKTYLIENFKPKTVNLRIQALNKYLEFEGKGKLRLKSVKVQQRTYLENVISNEGACHQAINKIRIEDMFPFPEGSGFEVRCPFKDFTDHFVSHVSHLLAKFARNIAIL